MCQMIDKHIPDSVDIITPYPKKDELQCYYLGPSIMRVVLLNCDWLNFKNAVELVIWDSLNKNSRAVVK